MSESRAEGIAIIGMAGRFPGAANVGEFWRNLVAGTESISTFSDEELAASGLDVAALRNDPNFVPARGVLANAEYFDAGFFGMNAMEASVTDPQHRLFLEASWEVLENAGYDPEKFEGLIGVYAGMANATYFLNYLHGRRDLAEVVGDRVISLGNDKDFLAPRVAYKLNLKGPALNINTACSTSLVTVCQACQELIGFQCDIALAGGISLTFPQKNGVQYQEGGVFSPDGHCRPFDAQARGTVSSDAVGVVLLKRLSEAIDDGDQILAVIRGFGRNNDGSGKVGFTAPSVEGQAEAIVTAQAQAGFDPSTISYIEAHGTATPLGDPIEISALTQAFRLETEQKNFCAIGSVKGNIGHTNSAAGVAGLIKTVLALQHRQLPPSLNYTTPNPKIDFADSPFFVNTKLTEWKSAGPRRAGVSSFGLGGTNAHVVLEEAPATEPSGPSRERQLVVLSAKSEAALNDATANLASHLKVHADLNLADAAYTLQAGRHVFEHRRILVCQDTADAAAALEKRDPKRVLSFVYNDEKAAPSVVFMFPGQGSQYVGMGAELYRSEPVFKEQIDRCAEILRAPLGLDLRDILYPTPEKTPEAEEILIQTGITQPALFAIEYALAQLWMSWGIKPAALTGHSLGEYVAACLAGVFTLEDALALVAQRGRLIQSMPRGSMLAVPMTEDELKKILPPELSIAGVNGPAQCVVSGPSAEINAFLAKLTAGGHTGRSLYTSHAFHSAMMDPVLQPFAECVRRVKFGKPTIPFLSNLTGTWITAEEARDPQYWARHLRQGVRFADGVKELLKNESAVFLEVGPGTTLGSLVKFQAKKAGNRGIFSSLRHAREDLPDLSVMLTALGQLWMRGVTVDWTAYHAREKRRRVALPGYAFQRERYWIERQVPAPAVTLAAPNAPPQREADIADWFYLPTWKRSELSAPAKDDHLPTPLLEWLLFVDEGGLGEKFAHTLAVLEENVTRVRIGAAYKKIADGVYAINPDKPEDYASLVTDLALADKLPQKIVHFWNVSPPGEQAISTAQLDHSQYLSLHSLLHLVRALGEKGVSQEINLEIVSNNVQAVTGEETITPEKATLVGAGKVIPQEYPNIHCRCTDVLLPEAGGKSEQRLLAQLLKEFSAPSTELVVAYRAGYRWIKQYDQVRLESTGKTAPRLKKNGVYLITGGLGGVGLALAEFLAASVQAKLVLIGRSALPPCEQWCDWLAAHDDDATSAKIRKVQALESAGADCLILAADVADRESMQRAITEAKNRFGRIDGVIHAAGSPDHAGVIQRRSKEATDEILAAKVQGTLVLDELLAGEKLDFLVLCSTIGTVILGGVFGQVGYVAANEFLDAFAFSKKSGEAPPTVSINWDNWSDVGMAANILREQLKEGKRARVLTSANSLTSAEGAEAFNRILEHSFAQVVVSVSNLEIRAKSHNLASLYKDAPGPADAKPEFARHARPEVDSAYVPPASDTEQVLAGIWQELLGLESVGVDDTFFDLGGDSLLLLRVQTKIRQLFDADLTSAEMFQYPTISALAKRLGNHTAKAAPRPSMQPAATPSRTTPVENRPALRPSVVEFPRTTKDDSHAIAIVGLAGRFPGAANVDEYWRNLVSGVESITAFSDEELAASGLNVAEIRRNPNYVASRGIIEDPDLFDASFFNFNAKEAELTDPQQRLFIETAWEALENAGYDPARMKGYVGVFAGMGTNSYFVNNLQSHPELLEQAGRIAILIGNEKDYVASRTAYKLNLRGPALSTNTACSTSLVNVCLAAQSLLGGQCDLALAGGVYVSFPQKRASFYQEGGIFSPDGHCRPFDAHAAGTYFSDGVGIVVLKRLNEALRDGDHVYAVIKGVGFNNDGADKVGFTAPGVQGQTEVITIAQAHAGVSPETISYIEAHGTATPLGDPIEIAALSQAFRAGTDQKAFCAIGSVKGNIGHLDAAAGAAGLIKTVLALKNKKLPATLNFSTPNPKIDFADSPFFVNAKLTDWKAGPTPRRAGVSAFGIGGTNAHVVLEEAPAPQPAAPSRDAQLLVFSAKTASALDAATTRFLAHLKANPDINLADAAYTLQVGRRVFPHRRMLVARDVPDAIQALESMEPKLVITRQANVNDVKDCPVVFMFPGQGAQYVKMGADLYRTEPVFRAEVDRCAKILAERFGLDLRMVLFPAAGEQEKAEKLLIETRITQPALFVIAFALAKLWISWGIKPQAMLSHSLGEFVAACLAGVFTLEDALTLVAGRSELVQALPGGAMLAVRLPETELRSLLPTTLSIAALNSPALSVVAGPLDAIAKFESELEKKGVACGRLESSHAFHSAMMDPVTAPFAKQFKNVKLQAPAIPYISNITGRWITPEEATNPNYWASHARETVRFTGALDEMLKEPQRALLEVGPARTLATFANQHPAKAHRVIATSILPSNDPEIVEMLNSLGRLWLAGKPVDWAGFYAHEKRQRVPLPTYPFERKRFWIERQISRQQPGLEQEVERPQVTRHVRPEVVVAFTPATKELERVLANIWQELLGIQEVGVDDNFFDLGGDSLLLQRVQAKILEALGSELSLAEMFEHPTISALARHLSQPATESAGSGSVQDRAQRQRAAMARQRQPKKRG